MAEKNKTIPEEKALLKKRLETPLPEGTPEKTVEEIFLDELSKLEESS